MRTRWPCALACAILLGGCAEEEAAVSRHPGAFLTKEDAAARSLRVDNVTYALDIALDGEAAEYAGQVRIGFDLAPGAADAPLTVDFVGGTVASVAVNDEEVGDPRYNGFFLVLPAAKLREGANVARIAFSHPYSKDGNGLYRFRDPVDGRDYLYTNFEPYNQNRLFPSFDQPDLKARFSTTATVPADWQVISVVPESEVAEDGDRRRWVFPESLPISTYIYALHAGHYRQWDAMAGEIPLRLFARQSLAEYIVPEHWFPPTQQGFAFFERYFDIPYPFGKYDQVIVPHFNAGAMENLGAVTFSERFLRRGAITRQARRSLASVILHEMAHMWFGNLVTMDWWNGLWLNESFASYMAHLAMLEATEFTDDALNAFRSKVRAYRADERDTTHPIEMPTPTTDDAFANFDAITYSKGAATLNQLRNLVGPDAFREGVSAYLKDRAYDNAAIDDFLGAISAAAGRDLSDWSKEWLHTPGTNSVAVEFECEDGAISDAVVVQGAPDAWPTLRLHRTQLGFYRFGADAEVRTLPIVYAGIYTPVEAARGLPCPDFVFANHGDWDYARATLNPAALDQLGQHLDAFEPLMRSMLWQSAFELVNDSAIAPLAFVDFAVAHMGRDPKDEVFGQVLGLLQSAWSYHRRLGEEEAVVQDAKRLEAYLWGAFEESAAGSDRRLMLFDAYVGTAATGAALGALGSLLESPTGLPDDFELDQDRRWSILRKLAGQGVDVAERLAEETAHDPSDQGKNSALTVRAAVPDPERQRIHVEQLLGPHKAGLKVAEARSIAGGLFPSNQRELQLAIVPQVFAALQSVSDNVDPSYFGAVTGGLLGTICDTGYLEQLEAAIADSADLHPSLRKRLLDMRFDVRRCLAIGEAMGRG